MNQRIEFDIKL